MNVASQSTPAAARHSSAAPRLSDYRTTEVKVGESHGSPRVWLQGRRIEKAGFRPGARYELVSAGERVTLRIAENGARVVSIKRRADTDLPIIDLNSKEALSAFEGLDRIRVVIRENEIHLLPLATQSKARERLHRIRSKAEKGEALTIGSLCHGGGVLSSALHQGMAERGVATTLRFANDIDEEVLEQAQSHNPAWRNDTALIAAPMQEIVADAWLLKQLGPVDVLEAGIPCVAASLAGRAKKGLPMAEADPNAGHLVVAFLGIVEAVQPGVVIVENVEPYQNTASAHLIRNTLRDWGYQIHETILSGMEFGALEDRKRMALVAVTQGLTFEMDWIVKPPVVERKLGEVLEEVPLDAACWSPMDYLREKEIRDKAAGKGFRMQIVGPEDKRVGTIGAHYQKNRSTEPKVRHPIDGDAILRLLTPTEHARVKGVPAELIEGMPPTRAHHLLGNGIVYQPFVALGRALAGTILAMSDPVCTQAAA